MHRREVVYDLHASSDSLAVHRHMQAVMSGAKDHPEKEQLQDAVSNIIPKLTGVHSSFSLI